MCRAGVCVDGVERVRVLPLSSLMMLCVIGRTLVTSCSGYTGHIPCSGDNGISRAATCAVGVDDAPCHFTSCMLGKLSILDSIIVSMPTIMSTPFS